MQLVLDRAREKASGAFSTTSGDLVIVTMSAHHGHPDSHADTGAGTDVKIILDSRTKLGIKLEN